MAEHLYWIVFNFTGVPNKVGTDKLEALFHLFMREEPVAATMD